MNGDVREKGRAVIHRVLTVTPLMENCSIAWCPRTHAGVVIDPGGESERILAAVGDAGVRLTHILLTHAHIDHVGAAGALARATGAAIWGPGRADEFLMEALGEQSELFGVRLEEPVVPERWLADGDVVPLGDEELNVLHCPGHTPGHVTFHCPTPAVVFTGDVLFQGSIGRTDLPGGSPQALLDSIRQQLWPLDDATEFVPGHGPGGTLGEERRTNPFLQ